MYPVKRYLLVLFFIYAIDITTNKVKRITNAKYYILG